MHITFRQMRLFLALADTLSVSAAARACHVSQPTASMQLREVTRALGLPLYEVVSRRVYLTEAGKELAHTARAMFGEWEALEQKIAGLQGMTRGTLRVAMVSTAKYFIPRLLGTFCAAHADIGISLEVLNREGVVQRLRDNLDDFCVMSIPPTDIALEDRVFLANPLTLVAAKGSAVAKAGPATLKSLAGQRFILREKGSGTRMAIDAHFAKSRFQPPHVLELGSNEAIKESVAAGLGISILSQHALHGHAAQEGLVELSVRGFPIASQWHIVYAKGKQLSPIAQVFLQHLLTQARV